ncbi:putative fad binding domain-containing protein [Neofusicoccum parvum UCRNP2]|uniref:Putative fad binding domain-containing protein n=1 Tax=Botryosphaeria parva (strain UCR-NP2) TaxID=1287680 RepID=R1G8Y9_BOTPV|nr:putative fad binding domain-containing protein [Neofusicoccum parvum UCRNP2]
MSPSKIPDEELREGSVDVLVADVPNVNGNHGLQRPSTSDVLVVGAGPAGLMLADNLSRFGMKVEIIDNRPNRTLTGRADGLQPKSIETLRQMRLIDPLLRKGVKVFDICFWRSALNEKMHRNGREVHYPHDAVDLLDPYILLVHQGMIEQLFIDDLEERGVEVRRNTAFMDFAYTGKAAPVEVTCMADVQHQRLSLSTGFVVGCDGAHSQVRKSIPGAQPVGASSDAIWGVLDGQIETNFPDLWSKAVIYSEEAGSVLIIPRERNLTRLYIELKPESRGSTSRDELTQEFVMHRAQEIMDPFHLRWKTVEWFGRYQVGQRVATKFTDERGRVYICGDASHTHSPKAAQGMNTSMHDAWNLAWKLNLAARKLAKPELLATYEAERRKIAQDLINFDYEHASAFAAGDSDALAQNFMTNVRFISGIGAEYSPNVLNMPTKAMGSGDLKPGCLPTPAKVTRYFDANPVDIQLDIPMLGQFRIYFFCNNALTSRSFIDTVCGYSNSQNSFMGRMSAAANASYTLQPAMAAPHDEFVCPERYTTVSSLFTYALVTSMPKAALEIADLPQVLRDSAWTVYLDDQAIADTRGRTCIDKWLGGLQDDQTAVAIVRPDGYVGSLQIWPEGSRECGQQASKWMDEYFDGFLEDKVGAPNY